MHHTQTLPSLLSLLGLVGLGLLAAGAAAVALVPALRRIPRTTAVTIGATLLAFQALHFVEHLIQLAAWFVQPGAPPYMTPWALAAVDGLASWFASLPVDARAIAGGMEGLHLIGNTLFFVGLLALRRSRPNPLPGLSTALTLQGLHLAEHVLLTATLIAFDTPLGLSTLFGAAEGATWSGTLRVWFHFMINLVATVPAGLALSAAVAKRSDDADACVASRPGASHRREPVGAR